MKARLWWSLALAIALHAAVLWAWKTSSPGAVEAGDSQGVQEVQVELAGGPPAESATEESSPEQSAEPETKAAPEPTPTPVPVPIPQTLPVPPVSAEEPQPPEPEPPAISAAIPPDAFIEPQRPEPSRPTPPKTVQAKPRGHSSSAPKSSSRGTPSHVGGPAEQSGRSGSGGAAQSSAAGSSGGGGRGDSRARWKSRVVPDYPPAARQARLVGRVLILVAVNALGQPTTARVLQSSGSPMLDSAALRAARASDFLPKKVLGVAVPDTVIATYNFRLDR